MNTGATVKSVANSLSVRELRNGVSAVLRRVEAGERFTVTVDRRPVAELIPLRWRRAVPIDMARGAAARHPADAGLLDDVGRGVPDSTDGA